MSEQEHAYVSRKPCGCIGIVIMEREHEAPKMVAAAMRRGETIERVVPGSIGPARCEEHKRPAQHEVKAAGAAMLPGLEDVPVRPEQGRGYPL